MQILIVKFFLFHEIIMILQNIICQPERLDTKILQFTIIDLIISNRIKKNISLLLTALENSDWVPIALCTICTFTFKNSFFMHK